MWNGKKKPTIITVKNINTHIYGNHCACVRALVFTLEREKTVAN